MSDQDTKKVLSLGGRPKLELPAGKRPGADAGKAGLVQQKFPHGRTNAVLVEERNKRFSKPATGPSSSTGGASAAGPRNLTQEERDARLRALRGAVIDNEKRMSTAEQAQRQKDAELEQEAVAEAATPEPTGPVTRETLRQREMEELRKIQELERNETATRRKQDEQRYQDLQASRRGEANSGKGLAADATALRGVMGPRRVVIEEEGESDNRRNAKPGRLPPSPRRGIGGDGRRQGRLTVTQALSAEDGEGRTRSMAAMRRRIAREKRQAMGDQEQVKVTRDVTLPEVITVQELANRMAERSVDVIKILMKLGVMATITQTIDADTAELVATEMGHRVRRVTEADVEIGLSGVVDAPEAMVPRPPVVTVMGHVDHGKTSLLDALRKSNVVSGEAGGITQHIGAYQVILPEASHGFDRITFIDTPGHAAFTEMRARGAQVTDIVVLVVAADDGLMPQTIEAIRHAKAANVPMIIAINKCDLPAANPMRIRQDLLQHDVQVEEMGGEVLSVEISAKTRMGLDKLLEALLLQAEILDLKANPDRDAEGAVVEARLEKGRGSVATVLIQRGTLRVGDIFVAGSEWGRVRALIDDHGKPVQEAPPAMPVEVLGLQGTPMAGDELAVVENESKAREISEFRARRRRALASAALGPRSSLEQMMQNIKSGGVKEMSVIIKGDVHGSVEAIRNALVKLTGEDSEVRVRVLDAAVGAITESDITLARASEALVIGFNVRANQQARDMAKRDGVELRYYSIIYNVIDDVKQALTGMLSPTLREKFLGNAEILQVFNITKVGKVAGCKVVEGVVKRGGKVRLLRDSVVIHEGTLKTLKRVKDEVKEVREGFECGMAFENYDNIEAGDLIECFEIEEIARQLQA